MHSNASADLSGFFRNSYSRVSVAFSLSAGRLNPGDVVREEVKKQMSSIMLLRPQRDGVAAQKASDVHERPHFPPTVSAALGWTGAALGVYALEFGARGPLAGVSRPAIALAKIAVILIAGAIYARRAGGLPAGFVPATGIAWLAFSIAADVITGIGSARAYQLLGNPSVISAILRDATIVAWLGAPTLFARNGIPVERGDDFARYR